MEARIRIAEEVFAEHGFDGARIDAIAEASGYNKSLIFQYFADKLGLSAAVIRRADDQMREWQVDAFSTLGAIEPPIDAAVVRELLRKYAGLYFDYLVEHPRFLRILNWELAEGRQTFAKIMTERDLQDLDQLGPFMKKLQRLGLMRSEPNGFLQFTSALYMCHVYLGIVPLYHYFLPQEDLSSEAAMKQGREFVIESIVGALLLDPQKGARRVTKRAAPR